jgi:hypothetical protein
MSQKDKTANIFFSSFRNLLKNIYCNISSMSMYCKGEDKQRWHGFQLLFKGRHRDGMDSVVSNFHQTGEYGAHCPSVESIHVS